LTQSPAKLLVGLTGGIASGKSTVARLLGELGCTVVDADEIVADLYQPGQAGALAVARLFGEEMLTAEGAVDRPRVGAAVFGDAEARKRLEAAIHPLVRERTNELLQAAEGIVVYEATLLVEAGRADAFDLVISVEASPEIRLARAVGRGMEEAAAEARMRAQGDGEPRRARADLVFVNEGTAEELQRQVKALYQELQERLRAREEEA